MNKSKKLYLILFIFLIITINLSAQISKYRQDEVLYNVSVVGAIDNPGVFMVPSSARVSEVIKLSENEFFKKEIELKKAEKTVDEEFDPFNEKYDEYIFAPENEDTFLSEKRSLRNIILKRSNEEIKVDLQRYYTLGEEENNPYVLDGDVIYIPSRKGEVSIYGAVNRRGNYELVEKDRVLDIIELALGLKTNAFLEKAEIVRFINDKETETLSFNLKNAISDPGCKDNIILQNDDRLIVRFIPKFHEDKFITIKGEVQFPGYYSIEENETTLLEILEKCGGPISHADLRSAFLQRRSREDVLDTEFERLKKMLIEDMTILEYEYFKTKSRELKGKFAIDFENLWNLKDKSSDIVLKNNDFIFMPDKSITITVSGQVKNPGLIKYVPGKNYLYYIEQAGGFSWNARKGKIRLIKADTSEWLKPKKDTIIEVRDMVFVPEKPDIDYWVLTKDVMRIVAEMATLIIVIQSITQ